MPDGGQRHVHDEILSDSIAPRARARIGRVGVGRNVGETVSGDRFGAVAVMIVEIHDQDAAVHAARCLKRARRDRNVIEDRQKPIPRIRLGVMAGRPHQSEDRLAERRQSPQPRRPRPPLPGARPERRPASTSVSPVERYAQRRRRLPSRAERVRDTAACARARSLRRSRRAPDNGSRQDAELAQAPRDRLDAIGPFGMERVANMIPIKGIDYELQPECLRGRRFARIVRRLCDVRVILRALLHHRQQPLIGRDGFRALIGRRHTISPPCRAAADLRRESLLPRGPGRRRSAPPPCSSLVRSRRRRRS